MTSTPILELNALVKRFPVKGGLFGPKKFLSAVNGVSLRIRPGETVLEPSAGTGALAGFAVCAGGKPMLNEIDPFRRALLEAVFGGEVSGFDAEHIDDLLTVPELPGVIVMNPPFASSVDRSRDKHIAAKHLIGAAKRLAPGGRLAAIMPMGFSPERDAAHWSRASAIAKPLNPQTNKKKYLGFSGPRVCSNEMQSPRSNWASWNGRFANMVRRCFVLFRKGCISCHTFCFCTNFFTSDRETPR